MTSVALNDKAPYRTVLTHGFVVDVDTRQKISKSNQGRVAQPEADRSRPLREDLRGRHRSSLGLERPVH